MFYRLFQVMTLLIVSFLLVSCGGTGGGVGETNGTIAITAPASIAAGKPLSLTVTFTSSAGVLDQSISISSNSPSISGGSAVTDSTGIATFNLITTNDISADTDVVLTAHAGGLTASTKVTLLANKLIITVPTAATATFPVNSIGTIQPTGDFITYTDGAGKPIVGQTVAISVNNPDIFTTAISGIGVFWDGITQSVLNVPIFRTTDSQGKIPASVYNVTWVTPGTTGTSTSVNVRFKFEINVPLGLHLIQYQDVPFTFTAK